MVKIIKKYRYFILIMAVLSALIITLFYSVLKQKKVLPIYQPAMVNSELVDSTIQYVRKYHTIADFRLINQNGDTITQENYKNKIYVADFFFTTCTTICPVMTKHMEQIQKQLLDDPEVLLLSHSVTPEIDTPTRLKEYAMIKRIQDSKWNLVTGDRKQIYDLARKSYLAVKTPGDGGPLDMIHTENFILIDKERRIRGFYDGTDEKEINRLITDIFLLKSAYAE